MIVLRSGRKLLFGIHCIGIFKEAIGNIKARPFYFSLDCSLFDLAKLQELNSCKLMFEEHMALVYAENASHYSRVTNVRLG